MSTLRPAIGLLLCGVGVVALAMPASSFGEAQGTTTVPAPVPAEAAPSSPAVETTTTSSSPAPAAPSEAPAAAGQGAGQPQVQGQQAQGSTRSASPRAGRRRTGGGRSETKAVGEGGKSQTTGGAGANVAPGATRAPSPSAFTPALPLTLSGSLSGVPAFFIENFRVPPFLLPIYQAAGSAYGIPWQVLAAINEVETDYGRDLSVSSAGAEGWMQFLPAEWAQYGVDATGSGFKDPYNPTDAIFAAARYLRAAGGDTNIRAAIYSYNHSQSYVSSVLQRAELLGGTPGPLLGAVIGLTEARFPVHAAAHFSDGFQGVPAAGRKPVQTLVGTTIDSEAGAPVIAAQNGEIVQVGSSPALGRFVSLRDAFGNTYVYSQLGAIAKLYPVLRPAPGAHDNAVATTPALAASAAAEPPPSGPATAGAQSGPTLSQDAAGSLGLGSGTGLEAAPASPPASSGRPPSPRTVSATVRVFREGSNEVYLHPLRVGAQVLAGTVLGHLGPSEQMLFQIRPAAVGAPLIDPKPILDGWVALENTAIRQAQTRSVSPTSPPVAGQVLLETQRQLERQVLHDRGVRLRRCERQVVQGGGASRRLLATLEFLSASGLRPTVTGIACGGSSPAAEVNARAGSGEKVDLTAVNSKAISDHLGPGSIAEATIHRLLALQGSTRPRRIVSPARYPGVKGVTVSSTEHSYIQLVFSPTVPKTARAAGVFDTTLNPNQWIELIARLGEIPNPTVSGKPSRAAIPDSKQAGAGAVPGEATPHEQGLTGGNN